jgi:molecular chaperone GrpE
MNEQRMTPPEQPPRQVTIRDKRRVLHDVPGAPTGMGAAASPGSPGAGSPEAPPGPPAPPPPDQAEELAAARAEAAGYLDDLQRLKAEFDNYRKRIVREQTGLVERAAGSLVLRLLPVLDNFELAVASAEDSKDFERMLRGIEMVFGELKEVLASEGLERIPAKGKPFDPNYHEAALEVAGEGDGEAYVADELRSGYTFKDRVVRPAMVKVARR